MRSRTAKLTPSNRNGYTNQKALLQTIAAIGLAALASAASAATTTYNFGSFQTGSGPTTPVSFATLTIDASADNKTFVFDLKVSSNLQSIFGSGAFILVR